MQVTFVFMQGKYALNSDDLVLISTLSKCGRLGDAATLLGVDHSTLFRKLEAIESRLGMPLFFRVRGWYRPTPSGQACAVAATKWTSQVADLVRGLTQEQSAEAGRLRITTTEDVATHWLPKCLTLLRSKYPHLVVDVHVDDKKWDLGSTDFDVAIRPTRTPPEGWVGVQVGKIEMAVYGDRLWRERVSGDGAFDWLAREVDSGPVADHVWMSQTVRMAHIAARFSTASSLLAAVRAGLGVALLPRFVAESSDLVRIDDIHVSNKDAARLWLLCHPGLRRDERVRTLFSVAREIARLP
jgi:DNA-binding transcriptional LysR family regulator